MSFLSPTQLQELRQFAHIADRETRSDLALGIIRDENDYTSNFTGALRRIINSNSESGLMANSFVLHHGEERSLGADAAIVLSRGDESKVAVFEAKWPRFSIPGYEWDYEQTASGLSHFSDQLARQKNWNRSFAVFEMFYCEHSFGKQPPFLNGDGSSCVWHDDADEFRSMRREPDKIWSQAELQKMLTIQSLSLSEILNEFGLCNRGKPIPMVDPLMIDEEYHLPNHVLAITARGRRTRLRE